jgi:hypothetical protein
MELTLTTTDIVAWWGAVVATLVLLWDVYKFLRQGPSLRINARPDMQAYGMPGREEDTFVIVEAVNVGDRPTTLTIIGLRYYTSHFQRWRRKPQRTMIVPDPALTQPLPHVLEPGKMWAGGITQNAELEQMAGDGILVCEVYDSWHKKPHTGRVKLDRKRPNPPLESDVPQAARASA